jgi:hypothetical protein
MIKTYNFNLDPKDLNNDEIDEATIDLILQDHENDENEELFDPNNLN